MGKPRILVVEDERVVAADIEGCLTDLGYAVAGSAASGLEALKRAVETEPDLVLMDVKLKGPIDGIDVAAELHGRMHIPVVYLTAYADAEILDRAKRTAPSGYVLKPFDGRALRSAIELALHRREMERRWLEGGRRLADALRSLEEGAIITEPRGAIAYLNPAAEALTGWKQENAHGRYVGDVFVVMNADSGALAPLPAARVTREGAAERLADGSVLIARDGARRRISGSLTPIRDEENQITGLALIFHPEAENHL